MERYRVKIIGTGAYLPGDPVKFDDIMNVLGKVNDAPPHIVKWLDQIQPVMKEMLGMEQSYYAIDPVTREFTESNVSMSAKAARRAMDQAGIGPEDIEFLAYGCQTLESMPTTSVLIQEELGIKSCGEMSIHANCTSAYKAVMLAHDLISLGRYKTVMVISSQMSSSYLRAEYYNQKKIKRSQMLIRWFLCDAAGCMILTRDEGDVKKGNYLEASYIESVGCGIKPFMFDERKSYLLNPLEVYENGWHHITQEGISGKPGEDNTLEFGKVFAGGVKRMADLFKINLADTRYFQINFPARHVFELMKGECSKLGIPEEAYYTKLYKYGYPGPPAALIALDSILREEALESGDQIVSFVTEVSKVMQGGFMVKHYS